MQYILVYFSFLFRILRIILRSSYFARRFLRHRFSRSFFPNPPFPTANASLNAFPSQTERKYSLSPSLLPQVHLLVSLSSKEKDENGNEVIRVCLVQIPLVNTDWSAMVNIHSITIAPVVSCLRVCRLFPLSRLADKQQLLESFNSRR